jgi:hypothetical protein
LLLSLYLPLYVQIKKEKKNEEKEKNHKQDRINCPFNLLLKKKNSCQLKVESHRTKIKRHAP